MGAQPLSARTLRRVARTTGLPVLFGNGNGGYWHHIVTRDHRHGWWHTIDHDWEPDPSRPCTSTCRRVFPGGGPYDPRADVDRPLLDANTLAAVLASRQAAR